MKPVGLEAITSCAPVEAVKTSPTETLKGSVFLFPLRTQWLQTPTKENLGEDECAIGDYREMYEGEEPYTLCAQAWIHSKESDNWADHGCSLLKGRITRYLPVRYFLGKKEGEVAEIPCGNVTFSLTCQQGGSRYGGPTHGCKPFESMLEDMFMVTYNNLLDQYRSGTLSKEEQQQWEIIDRLKQEHYPNSTNDNRGGNCTIM